MQKTIVTSAIAALLIAGAAYAQSAAYTWTGLGVNVAGSSKCPTYKMTIDVTVQGSSVKGLFLQEGRTQRHFEATLQPGGAFKTKAVVGGGNSMDVTGTINDAGGQILLDGYCKFQGPLTKK
jgi:hypothetical protein